MHSIERNGEKGKQRVVGKELVGEREWKQQERKKRNIES